MARHGLLLFLMVGIALLKDVDVYEMVSRNTKIQCGQRVWSGFGTTTSDNAIHFKYPLKDGVQYGRSAMCVIAIIVPANTKVYLRIPVIDINGDPTRQCRGGDRLSFVQDFFFNILSVCGQESFNGTLLPIRRSYFLNVYFVANNDSQVGNGFDMTLFAQQDNPATTTTASPPTTEGPPDTNGDCNCGVAAPGARIVGGGNANEAEYPWQGRVIRGRFYICGASIVSRKHLLSAAHCFTQQASYKVAVGVTDIREVTSNNIFNVSQIRKHPDYNSNLIRNDLAIMTLAKELNFDDTVRPVCLPLDDNDFPLTNQQNLVATGWGSTQYNRMYPSILQEVTLQAYTNSECRSFYGSRITDSVLCAGAGGGKDICFGDSGGPLIYEQNGRSFLVGVTSFTNMCGETHLPSGFARVTTFINWIRNNIVGECLSG